MSEGRERFDWSNLEPLPRKKREGASRELLADRKFHAHKAKHKGRNHIANWKRRQIALKKRADAAEAQSAKAAKAKSFIQRVRDYWSGECDEHP